MKSIAVELAYFFRGKAKQNLKVLLYYCAFLLGLMLVYATAFRYLMWHLEQREFSFIAGIYWVITVMTTLGFGDITFHSDPGYLFAALVTITGVVFLLIILPFGMISLFLAPWIEHRLRYHPTLELPPETSGHGRIGCAAAAFLEHRPVPFLLIDQQINPDCSEHVPVIGDATGRHLLQQAGIERARGVIVTTNNDNTNIFLTLSSRHSNPHIRIVARANDDANVDQLYAAGADFVVSNASVGANILNNILESKESVFLSEGISVFRRRLPAELVGKTIADSQIRPRIGCSIVALEPADGGEPIIVPPPEQLLEAGMGLILIGGPLQEELFSQTYLKT